MRWSNEKKQQQRKNLIIIFVQDVAALKPNLGSGVGADLRASTQVHSVIDVLVNLSHSVEEVTLQHPLQRCQLG